MGETTKKLKKKHRDSTWVDEDGDVWFYQRSRRIWVAISSSRKTGFDLLTYDGEPHTMFDAEHFFTRVQRCI